MTAISTKEHPKIIIGVVAMVALLTACSASSPRASMHGTVTVSGTGSCAGGAGSISVVVTDAANKMVGGARVGTPQKNLIDSSNDKGDASMDGTVIDCVFPFTVADLPSGKFYTAAVANTVKDYTDPKIVSAADLSNTVALYINLPYN